MHINLDKKRNQLLIFVVGLACLHFTAEKCRKLVVRDKYFSQGGEFSIKDCFDMKSGTVACGVKLVTKLYFYNMKSSRVETAREKAKETAVKDALAQGMSAKDAAKHAGKVGTKAAKLATKEADRVIGPIYSSVWDFIEASIYGGTVTEGFLRGAGTLMGTYAGGLVGEDRLGRLGYVMGSQLGSWIGCNVGDMVHDVLNAMHFIALRLKEGSGGNSQPQGPQQV